MTTRTAGTTTVTMLTPAPALLAGGLGLSGAQNAAGQVLALPHRDALALVTGAYAKFGSAARDTARRPTALTFAPTRAV